MAVVSFFAGKHIENQKWLAGREGRCLSFISFAVDKAENQDLSSSDTMEALISNVYAAYQFCDDATASEELHNLWNDLIGNGEMYVGKEDILIEQLNMICEIIRLNEA